MDRRMRCSRHSSVKRVEKQRHLRDPVVPEWPVLDLRSVAADKICRFFPNFWGAKISVTTWDPIKKEYRVTEVSGGLTETSSMILEGGKITARSESRKEGHITKY